MPELPEVEVLARHLAPLIRGKRIREVRVFRERVLAPTSPRELRRVLKGGRIISLARRGKYLLFQIEPAATSHTFKSVVQALQTCTLLGHLGMTGRMYLLPAKQPLPKHAAAVLDLGRVNFVFEDTRYFGRFTLDTSAIARLGPEPLSPDFTVARLALALKQSTQPVKVKLLDQRVVAGIGNIYASEALFRAGISPRTPACALKTTQMERLWRAIHETLAEAIECGSTVPLNFGRARKRDGLFYFGRAPDAPDFYEERLRVYDRAGRPCLVCGTPIQRSVQAARSTFHCPRCQRRQAR